MASDRATWTEIYPLVASFGIPVTTSVGSDNRKLREVARVLPDAWWERDHFLGLPVSKRGDVEWPARYGGGLDRSRCRNDKETFTYFCRKCQSADVSRPVLKQHSIMKPHPTIPTINVLSDCWPKEAQSQYHATPATPYDSWKGDFDLNFLSTILYGVRQILGYYLAGHSHP